MLNWCSPQTAGTAATDVQRTILAAAGEAVIAKGVKVAMILAMVGGILGMAWNTMVGLRLLQLGDYNLYFYMGKPREENLRQAKSCVKNR